jgi:hypothetical protein
MCILLYVKKLMGIVDKFISQESCNNEDEWIDKNANYQKK